MEWSQMPLADWCRLFLVSDPELHSYSPHFHSFYIFPPHTKMQRKRGKTFTCLIPFQLAVVKGTSAQPEKKTWQPHSRFWGHFKILSGSFLPPCLLSRCQGKTRHADLSQEDVLRPVTKGENFETVGCVAFTQSSPEPSNFPKSNCTRPFLSHLGRQKVSGSEAGRRRWQEKAKSATFWVFRSRNRCSR